MARVKHSPGQTELNFDLEDPNMSSGRIVQIIGAVIDVETPAHGAMKQIGPVGRLSQTPASIRPVAPEVGESRRVSWPAAVTPAKQASKGTLQRQLRHPREGVTILEFATIIATPLPIELQKAESPSRRS